MTEGNDEKPVKLVGAVTQAFRVLRVLSDSHAPLGVSSIARAAEVNPSTAFNILRTLVVENAARFDELSKTYTLGDELLKLSQKLHEYNLVEQVMLDLNRLATETGCLVGIWEVTEDRMILIERAVADRPMRLDMQVKQRMPLMLGAVGRALAAHQGLTESDLRLHFKQARWEGQINYKQYIREVRDAEKFGYGVDREALYPGVVSVASLILDQNRDATYGLTASGFTVSMSAELTNEVGERLAAIARSYSQR